MRPPPRLSARAPSVGAKARARHREELASLGAEGFLAATLRAAERLGLQPHWGDEVLFWGPDYLPEWLAVRPVLVSGVWARPRQRKSGCRWRVMLMVRKGVLTPDGAVRAFGLPSHDPDGRRRRVRAAAWDRAFEEFSVDFYGVSELRQLTKVLRPALASISTADTTHAPSPDD